MPLVQRWKVLHQKGKELLTFQSFCPESWRIRLNALFPRVWKKIPYICWAKSLCCKLLKPYFSPWHGAALEHLKVSPSFIFLWQKTLKNALKQCLAPWVGHHCREARCLREVSGALKKEDSHITIPLWLGIIAELKTLVIWPRRLTFYQIPL